MKEHTIKLTAEELALLMSVTHQVNQSADDYEDSSRVYLVTNLLSSKLLHAWQETGTPEFHLQKKTT